MPNNSLSQRAREIQEIVNNQQPLLSTVAKTGGDWSQFMSCIHAIQGTESALEAYCAEISNQTPIEAGKALLFYYGVSQALFIQQDAITNLFCSLKSLNIGDLNDSGIKEVFDEIREIRNDIGHPTDRHPPKEYPKMGSPFVQINPTPFADNICIVTDYPEAVKERQTKERQVFAVLEINLITIPPLIKKQETAIRRILDDVLEALKKRCN